MEGVAEQASDKSVGERVGRQNLLDLSTKVLALAVVLLPAVGTLVRYVAFATSDTNGDRLDLAWNVSVGLLVTTAIVALVPTFVLFLGYAVVWNPLRSMTYVQYHSHRQRRELDMIKEEVNALKTMGAEVTQAMTAPDASRMTEMQTRISVEVDKLSRLNSETDRLFRESAELDLELDKHPRFSRIANLFNPIPIWLTLAVIGAIWASLIMFLPAFPTAVVGIVPTAFAALYIVWTIRRREVLTFSRVWPAVVIVLILGAIGAGLVGSAPGTRPAYYVFDSKPGIPAAGRFQSLAQANGIVYLKPCESGHGGLVGVRQDAIVSIRPEDKDSEPSPSLWNILVHGRKLMVGLRRC